MKELDKKEKRHIDEVLSGVILFPGPKELYEDEHGYDVRVIPLGRTDEGVLYIANNSKPQEWRCKESYDIKQKLVEQGIVAIVNTSTGGISNQMYERRYGLPVAKKGD